VAAAEAAVVKSFNEGHFMGTHATKTIEKKKLSDGAFAVLIQCCDDPSTNSWHTLEVGKSTTAAEVTAWLADRHKHVQDSHATAEAVDKQLAALITTTPASVTTTPVVVKDAAIRAK
jgi:hypothetical protein